MSKKGQGQGSNSVLLLHKAGTSLVAQERTATEVRGPGNKFTNQEGGLTHSLPRFHSKTSRVRILGTNLFPPPALYCVWLSVPFPTGQIPIP